jgi:hypothetical protein
VAFYLVRARPRWDLLRELEERLQQGQYLGLRPFGATLSGSLQNARFDGRTAEAVWEEEDYCTPPLAQEREAVLDRYFRDVRVEPVAGGAGWAAIDALPSLWDSPPPHSAAEHE